MAGKKKTEVQLQRELESQEEWEECLAMEGMWVVDVYQEWCGPCQALQGTFKRLKNELGDTLLHFAIAKADTIDALEVYRGRCEPTFLFYAGGILVAFVHGANAPKVQRTITEQLAQEHKVLEGQTERKEVKDTVLTRTQEKALQQQEEQEAEKAAMDSARKGSSPGPQTDEPQGADGEVPKGVTVAIIKPDAVAEGKTEEIIKELTDKGIEIVAQEDRELTDDEARELYDELSGEEYFEELVKFMISGPSRLLVCTSGTTGETVITDVRDLLGPNNVEQAKEEAPDSLRAKYGDKGYMNALHAASSQETAAKEMAFFFPNLSIPTYLKKKENIQRTLALIRPEAFAANKDEVLAKIQEAGFTIALHKEVKLTLEQAEEFYKEHEGSAYFQQLTTTMSSGPLLALGLARDEAITGWREMLGPANIDDAQEQSPDSLRAKYTGASGLNQFHGSDSEEAAKKEINFFFPMQETVAVIKPSAMGTKDAIIDRIHEAGFRIAAQKETQITKDIVDMMYPNQTDKEYYDDLVNSMTSGNTMFMVLTKEGAVDGWRSMIGDTDPTEAKNKDPNSIRAQFGEDILNNAVHGSSNPEQAKEEMKTLFGDLEFNDDGTIKGEEPQLDKAEVGDTDETTDQTTAEDTTQDVTAGDTTATDGEGDKTAAEDADTTVADTTMAETDADTTVADTTIADTTVADTTVAETTGAETTEQEAAPAEEPAQDTTEGATTAEPTEGESTVPDSTVPESTVPESQDTTEATQAEADPSQEAEPADKPETDNSTAEANAESTAEQPDTDSTSAAEDKPEEVSPDSTAVEDNAQKTDSEPGAPTENAEDKPASPPADEAAADAPTDAPAEAAKTEEGGDKPAEGEATTEGNTTTDQTTEG